MAEESSSNATATTLQEEGDKRLRSGHGSTIVGLVFHDAQTRVRILFIIPTLMLV